MDLLIGVLGWLCVPVAYWVGTRASKPLVQGGPVPPEVEPDRFVVVARLSRGGRARQMFERGTPGEGEALELWDGATCRGRKSGPPT